MVVSSLPVDLFDVVSLDGQLMPPFSASRLDDTLAALGLHASTEAVDAGAASDLGLICPFWHLYSPAWTCLPGLGQQQGRAKSPAL